MISFLFVLSWTLIGSPIVFYAFSKFFSVIVLQINTICRHEELKFILKRSTQGHSLFRRARKETLKPKFNLGFDTLAQTRFRCKFYWFPLLIWEYYTDISLSRCYGFCPTLSVFTFMVITGSLPPHQSCTEEEGIKITRDFQTTA